ncbi:penicillin binding transpeptidase domain protein [Rickettsia parkeri str. Tate's Hell]|uniref:Beta-lactamase-like protein n=3 Tax=Rickettsia TaxID=780 RepID=Q92G80_RICCN|nr:beta-lactamase-like protein [Rickettsia conorii str. Malish 7]AFC75391.1 beta-lactamase [Rickettsia parkeri str. Portsmouth]KJV94790.1 penicillin binding transpeptidase domain protein [Rickettsia parkeri str. Grand Bay]KJV96526.1 penicillin binding transpeptidase domain protein [Rickettsia parkeri str. AT\
MPVSVQAQEMTKNILFIEDFVDCWKRYGKTGSGNKLSQDRTVKLKDRKIGWFIGWLQKNDRTVFFVHFIENNKNYDSYAGQRSKEAAKEKLKELINQELK